MPYAFVRLEDEQTTCVEARRSGTGYVGGVYVDIFPLDGDVNFVPLRIWKELRVAVICGIALGIASFGKIMLFDGLGMMVAIVVSLSLVAVVLLAMFVGCILPIGAKRVGLDPAVMASPFITTIVDALSLLIYFAFAVRILGL